MLIRWLQGRYRAARALRERGWLGYSIAVFASFAALGIRMALVELFDGFPFITFFPAIFLVGFFCGWRAGALCAAVGGGLAWYFLIEPLNSFKIEFPSSVIACVFYLLTAAIIVLLIAAMQRAHQDLQLANDGLEQRVLQRTAELEAANIKLTQEVTSRAAAEAQVRQLQKMEALGQLTSGLAHDFNNMLAIVIGSLEMAERHLERDLKRVRKCIENAQEGARRAADVTARLLAFSRRQALNPIVVDANKVVSTTSELLARTLGETIQIETVLAAGLWPAFADQDQLNSVILNLSVNARDAMPGGGKLTIETANTYIDDQYAAANAEVKAGQYVLLAVTDTGTGMPADVAERVFDPFFTTKGPGKGTGLGMSQVYGFVKQSGGHVKIYSEIGVGTTVKVYLPRYHGESKPAALDDRAKVPPDRGTRDEVILVVEDDPKVRAVSADALRDLGYTVLSAEDTNHALALLKSNATITLLFTDVVMPEMNGRQLANRARDIRPDLRVLYTTGYTRNAIVHSGVLDHGVALLPKPFTLNQLARKIRDVLG